MRLWLVICLLLPLKAFGAAGDVVSCKVRPDGWSADVAFEGYTNGAGYNFRFVLVTNISTYSGTNYTNVYYTAGPNTPRLTLSSPGFNPDGSSNWTSRTVYMVSSVRSNYPNQAVRDYVLGSGFITNRMALSDFVCAEDGNITFDDPAGGVYSNSTPVTALSVANNSTLSWASAKSVAGFTWPGWNLEQGSTMQLRAVGFAQYGGTNGNPLAAMQFVVTPQTGTPLTNFVTAMVISNTVNDALPFGEYIWNAPLTSFANSNRLRCDITAYPRYGIPASVFSTHSDLYLMPTNRPAAITNFYFTNTYSVIAVVSLDGSDVNGRATNTTAANVASAHYFATVNKAAVAIAGTNNTAFGHNDVGGGFIYVRAGVSNAFSGSTAAGNTPDCWVTIAPYPGDTVVFTNTTSGDTDISDRVKIENIELAYNSASQIAFFNCDMLWLNRCVINSSTAGPFSDGLKYIAVTGGSAPVFTQGLKGFSNNKTYWSLVRGLNMDGLNADCLFNIMAGCKHDTYGGTSFTLNSDSATTVGDWQILYNNRFLYISNTITFGAVWGITNGMAIVQNVFEQIQPVASFQVFSARATGNTNAMGSTNVIFQQNTIEGVRSQYFYNATVAGVPPLYYPFCQTKNSIFMHTGEATDTDLTGDATHVGDWPVRYRVGSTGNVVQMVDYLTSHGQIEWPGLNSFYPRISAYPLSSPNITSSNFMQYVNRKVASVGTGGGDYHIRATSPVMRMVTEQLLPFDIEGYTRTANDPPGAFVERRWYVDNAAGGSNNGTSWVNAWTDITNAVWGASGVMEADTLCISGGSTSKTYTNEWTVGASGTVSNRITIRNALDLGHTGIVFIDGSRYGTNCPTDAIICQRDFITINGLVVRDWFNHTNKNIGRGIYAYPAQALQIYNCVFSNINTGIFIREATNFAVGWCRITAWGDACVAAYGGGMSAFDTGLVFSNQLYCVYNEPTGGPDGIQGQAGMSVFHNRFETVVDNTITNRVSNHIDYWQSDDNRYLKFHSNDFVNNGDSALSPAPWTAGNGLFNVRIYNNIFRITQQIDPYPQYIRMYNQLGLGGYTNVHILNNLFVDRTNGTQAIYIGLETGSSPGTNNILANNIFVNVGMETALIWQLEKTTGAVQSAWSITNNIMYHPTPANARVNYLDTNYTVAQWKANFDPSTGTNLPAFVSYTVGAEGNDFNLLLTDTAAKDQGLDYSAIFTTDYDGSTRVAPWDIGPFEGSTAAAPGNGGGSIIYCGHANVGTIIKAP